MTSHLVLAPVLLVSLALLGACGDDDDGGGAAKSAASRDDLDGRTFVGDDVTGYDLVAGTVVSIGFEGDSLGALAGCNSMSGGYELDGDVLVVGTMISTLMACEPDLQAQDQWLSGFLTSKPRLTLEGDVLTLANGEVTIGLTDEASDAPDAGASLDGTAWRIASIDTADGSTAAPDGASIAGADGRAAIATGCNSGSAEVQVDGDQITFGPVALTRMACDQQRTDFETALVALLAEPLTYAVTDSGATLTAADGTTIVLVPLT